MNHSGVHQYIDRASSRVCTETLMGDRMIRFFYTTAREKTPVLFKTLTSARMSSLLGFLHYDIPPVQPLRRVRQLMDRMGIDPADCLDPPDQLDTLRKLFERKIRYRQRRPMPDDPAAVVSPADSRMLIGSFAETSSLFVKEKFFDFEELIGTDKPRWLRRFCHGDFAVFRLTPEKYHYNHTPVAGRVADVYEIPGRFHSCNPGAVISLATPFSKNKRVVTIFDTNVEGGTGIGMVAMIEVVALMIGDIVQSYSDDTGSGYDDPKPVYPGMMVRKGVPKSLYRPGSSVDVLIFEKGAIDFSPDILHNLHRKDAVSRFSMNFGRALVETDVRVRSVIGKRKEGKT